MNRGGEERGGGAGTRIVTLDFTLLFAAAFLFMGSLYLVIPILALYMTEVAGATTTQVGLLMGLFTISSMAMRPFIGRKADTWGRKPLMIAGCLDFVVASLLYIVTRSVWTLPFVLVFHGVGVACFHTASLTFVGDIAPVEQRGKSMSWFQSSFNVAIMLAPPLAQYMKDSVSFTPIFILASAAAAAAFLVTTRVSETKVEEVTPLTPRPGKTDRRGLIFLACVAGFCGTITLGASESFISLFGKANKIGHWSLFFTFSAGLLIALRFVAGGVPDRVGRKWTIVASLVVLGVSMIVLSGVEDFLGLSIAAFVYGTGFAFLSPAISALLTDRFSSSELGGAFGLYTSAFEGGIAVGAILMGPLTSAYTFRVSFLAVGCVALLGSVIVVLLYNTLIGKD